MKASSILVALGLGTVIATGAYYSGGLDRFRPAKPKEAAVPTVAPPPAVSVVRAAPYDFVETVTVTGSLVAREEILVSPEVEGLRVTEILADEGDTVKKGDRLAVLESATLDAQLAQNEAALARATAAMSQARSQITDGEARLAEAKAALERARPLTKSGYVSESTFDQREAAAKSAAAQVAAARDGLKLAEAQKAEIEAQRRELSWRRSKTDVLSPADGIVSRRGARLGAIAVGSLAGANGEPLFRIIERGEIELDAEAAESDVGKIEAGQPAAVVTTAGIEAHGEVRLVSPEVDKATRLGRVKVFLGANSDLKIGAFARGTIETQRARALAVPRGAILYGENGTTVQVVVDGKVAVRRIVTGLAAKGQVEVRSGLAEGDAVVAKSGTFLRDGDAVRAVGLDPAMSEAAP